MVYFYDEVRAYGIGYIGHEVPNIKQSNHIYLERGMAFTIEPGIYLANKFGVRNVDDIVITENGTELLTSKLTKEIVVF